MRLVCQGLTFQIPGSPHRALSRVDVASRLLRPYRQPRHLLGHVRQVIDHQYRRGRLLGSRRVPTCRRTRPRLSSPYMQPPRDGEADNRPHHRNRNHQHCDHRRAHDVRCFRVLADRSLGFQIPGTAIASTNDVCYFRAMRRAARSKAIQHGAPGYGELPWLSVRLVDAANGAVLDMR